MGSHLLVVYYRMMVSWLLDWNVCHWIKHYLDSLLQGADPRQPADDGRQVRVQRRVLGLGDEHGAHRDELVGEGVDQGMVLILQVFLDHLPAADPLEDLQEAQLGPDGGALAEALAQDAGQPTLKILENKYFQNLALNIYFAFSGFGLLLGRLGVGPF